MARIAKLTSMQFVGLEELRETLTEVAPREANNILRNTVHAVAGVVRDRMKVKVVKDTRDLEKSIYTIRRRGKPNFPVSEVRMRATPHSHGLMLEFGTSKTRAQPFIVPTVEELRPDSTRIYREEFGKKLEKSLAKSARKVGK